MINVKPIVLAALKNVSDNVFFIYPDSFKTLPCISYREDFNSPQASADDMEYMSRIIFTVDVWGKTSEEVSSISIAVDAQMESAGFVRDFATDVLEPNKNLSHKNMRFKLIK